MEAALMIFAPLLSKCFAGTLAPGVVDRHCFTSVYDGAHIRDTHVVSASGKPVYSGETIYSMGPESAEFTYVNSDGGVGHGTVSIGSTSFTFSGSMAAKASAPAKPLTGKWIIGADGYDVVNDGRPAIHFSISPDARAQ